MKKEYKIAIIVLLIAVSLVVIGVVGYSKLQPKYDKYSSIQSNAKNIFVESCAGEGTTRAECTCMYDWLDENLTNDEFKELIKDSVDGKISDHIWSASKACVTI